MIAESVFSHFDNMKVISDDQLKEITDFITKYNKDDRFKRQLLEKLRKQVEEANAFIADEFRLEDMFFFIQNSNISAVFKIVSSKRLYLERGRINFSPLTIKNVLDVANGKRDIELDIKKLSKMFPRWLQVYTWRKFVEIKAHPDGTVDVIVHNKNLKHPISEIEEEVRKVIKS